MSAKRHPWPDELKMPLLIDEQLSIARIRQAIAVAQSDGPPMTLDEGLDWLELNVHRAPHPPSSSKPPGARAVRARRRYSLPAGRPGQMRRRESSAA